jgi:hypothetical protein
MPKPRASGYTPSPLLWGAVLGGFAGGQVWLLAGRPDGCYAGWCVLAGAALGLVAGWCLCRAAGLGPLRVHPVEATLLLLSGLAQCFLLNDFVATNVRDADRAVELRFVVADGRTGAPIPGARVRLSLEDEPKAHGARTAPDGTARLVADCYGSERIGWFTTTRKVYLIGWEVLVSKAGYAQAGPILLSEHTGQSLDEGELPPPPVPVRLHKLRKGP